MGSVLERPQVEPLMLSTVVSTGLLLVFGQDSPSLLSPLLVVTPVVIVATGNATTSSLVGWELLLPC